MKHFGIHLTLDCYSGNEKKLGRRSLVYKSVDRLPSQLAMNKLGRTVNRWAEPNHLKDCGGWSAFCIIAESHIAIHTFPKIGFASIDVYTCKNEIDSNFVMDWFSNIFEFEEMEPNLVIRGRKFPFHKL
jgi:S-adenosylmethionine decarboxylase